MTAAPGDPDASQVREAPDDPVALDAPDTPNAPVARGRATRPPSSRLNREILALAVPSFLSTISVPLVGIADTALVGRLGPVAYIGAVAIGSVLFDTLYWAFGFLRMGTTALVAQAYGAGDDRRCGEILIQSALLALVVGLAIIVLRDPAITIGLRLAGGSPEVQEWARAYMLVRILGAPAVILTYALHGFFRGMKDAVTPLVVTVVVNVINVGLDVGLIHGRFGLPALGVVGAAWASLAAVYTGVLVALGVLALSRYRTPLAAALPGLLRTDGVLDPRRLRRLATTHTNLFGRTLLLMAAYFLMVASASRLGEIALAANAIILHFWHLTAYSVDGVAFATETLVGNALGAGDAAGAHRLARRSMVWGVMLALLYSATYLVATRPLAGLFTTDLAVIAAIESVALLTVIAMPVNAVAFIYDGVFIGANDMPYLFRQMSVSFVLVFLPAVGILVHLLDGGLASLWLAMVLFMAARAVTLHWRYRQPAWMEGRLAEALRGG